MRCSVKFVLFFFLLPLSYCRSVAFAASVPFLRLFYFIFIFFLPSPNTLPFRPVSTFKPIELPPLSYAASQFLAFTPFFSLKKKKGNSFSSSIDSCAFFQTEKVGRFSFVVVFFSMKLFNTRIHCCHTIIHRYLN